VEIDVAMFQQVFFEEAGELLADFEAGLLRLEENPTELELLNSIFRCAHSLKGGSSTFGLPEIAQFTHGLETLLDRLRGGQVKVTPSLCVLLLDCLDQLRILLDSAMGSKVIVPDSTALKERVEAACGGEVATMAATENAPDVDSGFGLWAQPQRYRLRFYPGPDVFKTGCDPQLYIRSLREIADVVSISCDTSRLPALAELDPFTCYLGWDIELVSERESEEILAIFEFIADESEISLTAIVPIQTETTTAETEVVVDQAAVAAAQPASKTDSPSLRVSSEKVDGLINLVGELLINQSMLIEVTRSFDMAKLPRLLEAVTLMERASRELQERVMGIRLVPVKQAFSRFPRLVRDLSAACKKKIELKTSGEETELDKSLIEAIGDPLTHLVRNSIDHGLETPEERKAAGKGPVGTLLISAFHEGGSFVIEVADDGRGLSRDRILAKAIERGVISSDDNLTDDQVYNLIFLPGFSTAQEVTDLSGRGVGMDIVKQAVHTIGGSIKVSSKPGEGVSTRIRLPLTMAILEGQSMTVGESVYIVPLTSIVESIRPRRQDLHHVANVGEVVTVRGEFLPVLRLYESFNIEPQVTDPWEGSLVLVESEGRKVALMADELIGQGQVVIKSLETNYRKVEGIAGATILGDGRVALIIDVSGLIRDMGCKGGAHQSAA